MKALVRPISDSFAAALTRGSGPPPDVEGARAEHAAYVAALSTLVDEVVQVPPDHAQPDACFVEDMLVVFEGLAVLGRSGAMSRRAEQQAVARALPASIRVETLPEGALLDGGDVLRIEDQLFVGLSARTNASAAEALEELYRPRGLRLTRIQVGDALHLKCHVSHAGGGTVVLAPDFVDPAPFAAFDQVHVPRAEAWAANVVGGLKRPLIADGYPVVYNALNARGFDPIPLPIAEIAKADGSLTCLSILVD